MLSLNRKILNLKSLLIRIENWCRRIRHRHGYGVHSPSDFYLITSVIYEKLPYYAYQDLHALRTQYKGEKKYREKVDRLIFRIANHLQPAVWTDDSPAGAITPLYIEAACPRARCVTIEKAAAEGLKVELAHIASEDYRDHFERLLPLVCGKSCFIIGTPHESHEKEDWWKEVIADPRTGVTFDLYDIGLVFFNMKRFKEHRIVNFF